MQCFLDDDRRKRGYIDDDDGGGWNHHRLNWNTVAINDARVINVSVHQSGHMVGRYLSTPSDLWGSEQNTATSAGASVTITFGGVDDHRSHRRPNSTSRFRPLIFYSRVLLDMIIDP